MLLWNVLKSNDSNQTASVANIKLEKRFVYGMIEEEIKV